MALLKVATIYFLMFLILFEGLDHVSQQCQRFIHINYEISHGKPVKSLT